MRTAFGADVANPATVSGLLQFERARGSTLKGEHMSASQSMLPPAEVLSITSLVTPTAQGIASRVLARTGGGNLTLFAFDRGQELSEHTAPFDALVITLEGSVDLTIGGNAVRAAPGSIVLMPANVPHAVAAPEPARMLLIMLREQKA
jgi:quercetin dioxygenase-like cupin family protein